MLETFTKKAVQVICAAALTLSGADAFAGNNCKASIQQDEQWPMNNRQHKHHKEKPIDIRDKTKIGENYNSYRGLNCWWDGNEFNKTVLCLAQQTRKNLSSVAPKKV